MDAIRAVRRRAELIQYVTVEGHPGLRKLRDMIARELLTGVDGEKAIANYIKAINKGVVKVISKMGISTIQSYCGAQIFEAIGLNEDFVDRYFTWTPSRIGGIGLDVIAEEVKLRHKQGFPDRRRMNKRSAKAENTSGGEKVNFISSVRRRFTNSSTPFVPTATRPSKNTASW